MVQFHKISKTKKTGSGGHLRRSSDKAKKHFGGFFSRTKLIKGEGKKSEKRVAFKTLGGSKKVAAEYVQHASITQENGKSVKTKIKNVVESPDNRHHARENVITKGTIIETEAGKARVTSRPGQRGTINAVLLK
ncbi:MAG: 30S ribosomal protein S8e [Candidatus Micrarchaeia archaeon]